MKVWRNAEGREFPVIYDVLWNGDSIGAKVGDRAINADDMEALGYGLVESEPVSFEVNAYHMEYEPFFPTAKILHPKIVPGKRYRVTEVTE